MDGMAMAKGSTRETPVQRAGYRSPTLTMYGSIPERTFNMAFAGGLDGGMVVTKTGG